jgi:hypothetical protein
MYMLTDDVRILKRQEKKMKIHEMRKRNDAHNCIMDLIGAAVP